MKLKPLQIVLLIGAIAVATLVYILPREGEHKADTSSPTQDQKHSTAFDIAHYVDEALSRRIKEADKQKIDSYRTIIDTKAGNERAEALDSLATWFDKNSQPEVAAYYKELKATTTNAEKDWLDAAYRYFDGFKNSVDSVVKAGLVAKAISSYEKVLKINPANLDAKTDLGVCYTETTQPMQGITLLREVINENPRHEMAQLNLGVLSVRSRQFDKAIDRFKKVLEINPNRRDVLLYLADACVEAGQKPVAVEYLEKYVATESDVETKKEVLAYIRQLKEQE